MRKPRAAMLAMACAVAAVSAITYVGAQGRQGAAGAEGRGAGPRGPRDRHLVYIATPGDDGTDNQSGVVVLDADKDYSFLKRIPYGLPAAMMPGPKMAGITASVPLQMLYVTSDGWMKAIDLSNDSIAWTFNGEAQQPVQRTRGAASGCCERPWTLPDGKTLLVGSSYNSWWYYIDGVTGKPLSKLPVPETPVTHNLAVSADGKVGIMGSMSSPPKAGLAIIDVPNKKVLRYMTFTEMVRPLTINHDATLTYVNVNDLIGFEIGEVQTGKVLGRFELPGADWKGKGYSHGIGMTPDESEIWVADPVHNAWQVWDNPGDGRHPVYNASKMMKPTAGVVHSWIAMSNDGKLAFIGDSSVYDVKTHKEIAVMKDEFGRRIVHTEKALYMTFREGKLIETNNQFAVGDAKAYAARISSGKTNN
jgi:hypothetical protein